MMSTQKTMLHFAAIGMFFIACLVMPGTCPAQSMMWTWMSGSDQIEEIGSYGTKGVPDADNVPGGRYDSTSWTDASGNLWLFGGIGFDGDGVFSLLNDLWRYDSSTGEWTWMSGSDVSDQTGVYGTRGVANAANTPGARRGVASWIDSSGDLWLYGGQGYDSDGLPVVWDEDEWVIGWLNDMWRYNTATNQWSWEAGADEINDYNEKGYHDDKGYPQDYVRPGAREGAISWIDSFGFMWMFGGYGWQHLEYFQKNDEEYCWEGEIEVDPDTGEVTFPEQDCPAPGALNDLWVYNKATREWAWVSGSDDTDELGFYGTLGEEDCPNVPGARISSIPWIDKDNNLWLFGGIGKDSQVSEDFVIRMSDLWRFNPVTKKWAWMSGPAIGDQIGIYDESIGDLVPGCREESISWTDSSDKLWLFGGFGQASTFSPIGGLLNDLWVFDTETNEWAWLSGSDQISNPNDTILAGVYGTRGVPDENNVPGARSGMVSWIDGPGNLWLFGGLSFDSIADYGFMNDLWCFGVLPCLLDEDCDDDLFCNGDETCVDGECVDGTPPCIGDTPVCDEELNICTAPECLADPDCNDGLFCNGEETCVSGICVDGTPPCSGDTPICDEIADTCLAGCIDDSDCQDAYKCQDGACVPGCRLSIQYKPIYFFKLFKPRKVKFRVIGPPGLPVDFGPDIEILKTKPNLKKGFTNVRARIPAGMLPQIIPVRVGDCFGEIEIQ
jgi:hypothetical protein